MRIVLDTNVLIGAAVSAGLCRNLVKVSLLEHSLVTSEPLLHEFERILRQKFGLVPEDFSFVTEFYVRAKIVAVTPLSPPVCRDKDDDWVLATALAGNADAIVTGDDDLLALKKFRGVQILSPRKFLELMDRR